MIDYTRPPSNLARAREVLELIPRAYRGLGHLGPRGPVDGPKCLVVPGFIATDRTLWIWDLSERRIRFQR